MLPAVLLLPFFSPFLTVDLTVSLTDLLLVPRPHGGGEAPSVGDDCSADPNCTSSNKVQLTTVRGKFFVSFCSVI